MLTESYLARFEKNSGIKKGVVSNLNGLYESYMSDAKANGSIYKFFVVLNGKIVGGNEYKEDAVDLQKEYLEGGVRAQVFTGVYLKGKGIDVNDDSTWGDAAHIDAATGRNPETGKMPDAQVQQEEACSGPEPEQYDVDHQQSLDYEEAENDKEAESQDSNYMEEDTKRLDESFLKRFYKNVGVKKRLTEDFRSQESQNESQVPPVAKLVNQVNQLVPHIASFQQRPREVTPGGQVECLWIGPESQDKHDGVCVKMVCTVTPGSQFGPSLRFRVYTDTADMHKIDGLLKDIQGLASKVSEKVTELEQGVSPDELPSMSSLFNKKFK